MPVAQKISRSAYDREWLDFLEGKLRAAWIADPDGNLKDTDVSHLIFEQIAITIIDE
jgi:hypothetical protein